MKISTKGQYGLTIMIDLAKQYGEGPVSLKSIAEKNNLSVHYLEQIASPLRNATLIKSVRGAYGGYKLAKDPSLIKAGDIIRCLEGPLVIVEGIEDEEPAKQALWLRITEAIKQVLDTTTLEELTLHDKNDELEQHMFYI